MMLEMTYSCYPFCLKEGECLITNQLRNFFSGANIEILD